jgi:hypothetical protein
VVCGGARSRPSPWRTEGKGLDEVARRALLEFVIAPQVLLDSGVGGTTSLHDSDMCLKCALQKFDWLCKSHS